MKKDNFAYYLSKYFQSYLSGIRNVSENTIYSYRDMFTKLLMYYRDIQAIQPERISFSVLTKDSIESFLEHLETEQGCSISTRNQRLAAVKSFFRYVQVECPDLMLQCQSILSIKSKKHPTPVIEYLTVEETKILFEQPDTTTVKGLRDLALLSLMYESAARVQEICDLNTNNIRLKSPATVRFHTKIVIGVELFIKIW